MPQGIVLGTAQWGSNYGATNPKGRLEDGEIRGILQTAREGGIRKLDTASNYGDAEFRATRLAAGFHIQTKISVRNQTSDEVQEELASKISSLREDQSLSLLIHDWSTLEDSERHVALEVLTEARDSGEFASVGISIYDEFELTNFLEEVVRLDVIQVPTSILDQRLVDSSAVKALRDTGVRIQARSVFLQGVLLNPPLKGIVHLEVSNFWNRAARLQLEPIEVCLGFIKAQDWIDEVVIGVASATDLSNVLRVYSDARLDIPWSNWESMDKKLIDPRQW